MQPVEPILTVELFPELSAELLVMLRGLSPQAWEKPTVCVPWTVKDVAAHLLDTSIRRLSFQRDGMALLPPDTAITSYADLVGFLDQLNADWVRALKRVGPKLLIELLDLTDRQLYEFLKTLPGHEPAFFGVAWAGEAQSLNWFDIAREYTERWLHLQHIREAVGWPLLVERKFLFPVLDTFMRALPYTYQAVEASAGAIISVRITGQAGGEWSLRRQAHTWQLLAGLSPSAIASVSLDQDTAWRLFTKGISPEAAQPQLHCEGDQAVGLRILQMVSIMA
jgi:uncharacterized protein (TIGR03083 family)